MSQRLNLGTASDGTALNVDLGDLLKSRALIQAASGGGKSWLLRRIAEEAFGKVQVIIIDPEGEFSTLREGFGFVLVGKDGEAPADPATAGLLAHKLLELGASAVCDLFEMKAHDRHLWVKNFVQAMVDAPKNLWKPVIVIVDEAHHFVPEKGQGESAASPALIDLITRGRKRGFCPILATQRLGKLSKNAAAELQNVIIGNTFMDIDRDRAADTLGIPRKEHFDFFAKIRGVLPGSFFALGTAISRTMVEFKSGPVRTSHVTAFGGKTKARPSVPPTPESVKPFLEALQGLPAEHAEQVATMASLREEVASLKRQLRAAGAEKSKDPAVPGEVASLKKQLQQAQIDLAKSRALEFPAALHGVLGRARQTLSRIRETLAPVEGAITDLQMILDAHMNARVEAGKIKKAPPVLEIPSSETAQLVRWPSPFRSAPQASEAGDESGLPKCAAKILQVLYCHRDGVPMNKAALLSGYSISGSFKNNISVLRTKGLAEGSPACLRITQDGVKLADESGFPPLPTGEDLWNYWFNYPEFGSAERSIMAVLRNAPANQGGEELASRTGRAVSGSFKNNLSTLRTAGVIEGKFSGPIDLTPELREAVGR